MKFRVTVLAALAAFVSSQAASAADFPTKAPNAVVATNWSGCYIGVNGGGGWSQNDWSVQLSAVNTVRASGLAAGGQIGCDYQAGAWVFGIEGQFDWADIGGQSGASLGIGSAFQLSSQLDRFATGTGRVGYAFDRVLVYAKGGFAWGHFNHAVDVALGNSQSFSPVVAGSQEVVGFVVGGGFEVAVLPNWSFKAEYNYMDFGTNSAPLSCVAAGGACPLLVSSVKQNAQMVTIGLNYRFAPMR